MKAVEKLQEDQYEFPYHYIPRWGEGEFSQTRHWSWGFRYLGGLQVVFDLLQPITFDSLVDIGCGDGRFLREAVGRFPGVDLLGVDYSKRAISMAKGLNPEVNYRVLDLTSEELPRSFDAAVMIEVLEHIKSDEVDRFIARAAGGLSEDGYLILTVPHENKPVSDKHYQHFDSQSLLQHLQPHFDEIELVFFDTRSRLLRVISTILGGRGKHYVVTNSTVMSAFYSLYKERFLYSRDEASCGRIAVRCRLS